MIHTRLENHFFFLLFAGALVLFFFLIKPFLSPLVVAIALAIIFWPVHKYILRIVKGNKTFAALLSVLLICIVVLIPVVTFGFQVFQEARDFYIGTIDSNQSSIGFSSAVAFIERNLGGILPDSLLLRVEALEQDIQTYMENVAVWVLEHLGVIFTGLARFLLSLFIAVLGLFYLFRDGEKFLAKIIEISPLADRYDTEIFTRLHRTINSVVRGVLVIAVIQAVLTGIGFVIFGVPKPALWAAVAMIGALIPGVGTALVLIPAIIYLFIIGSVPAALGLLVWGMIAVGLVDNFLSPKLIGGGAQIHPYLILLSVLGGIALFGPLGFITGPLVLSLLYALIEIYKIYQSHKKDSL